MQHRLSIQVKINRFKLMDVGPVALTLYIRYVQFIISDPQG